MIELEELRAALHDRQLRPLPELDLAAVMGAGRRMRRHRRVRVGVISVLAAASLLGVTVVVGHASHQTQIEIATTPRPHPSLTSRPTPSADSSLGPSPTAKSYPAPTS